MCKSIVLLVLQLLTVCSTAQTAFQQQEKLQYAGLKTQPDQNYSPTQKQFLSTVDFLDACINSLNSFNSLLKREAYRIKITSLNNPTSSDMGFNLENEVQAALRPLLEKAKSTNPQKILRHCFHHSRQRQ